MCVNESQLQSKVKSLEKRDLFLGIFSVLHVYPLANVRIFHFCSVKGSRCFLKNLSLVQSLLLLLTCEAEPKALDGEESGDNSKGSRCARGSEEGKKAWGRAQVTVVPGYEIGFATFYFTGNDSREFL